MTGLKPRDSTDVGSGTPGSWLDHDSKDDPRPIVGPPDASEQTERTLLCYLFGRVTGKGINLDYVVRERV